MDETRNDNISIITATQQHQAQWNDYLFNSDDGSFYQRFEWNLINSRNFSHQCFFLMAMADGTVHGIFPLVLIKSTVFGKILSSMPFVNFGGVTSDDQRFSDLLLEFANLIAEQHDVDYAEIRSLSSLSSSLPTAYHKISMTLDLDPDPDVIWNSFKSKHRTNIRRVYKNNIQIKQGHLDLLEDFYTVMAKSWRSLGTPFYRKSYFRDILETFGKDIKIFIAYHNNRPIATAFNGHHKDTVEGMWAGTIPNTRHLQVNYALYWEMIKDACEQGFSYYHLGRSTADSGAESFKRKWNAYDKQLYLHYILNRSSSIPELNVNNPKFQMAIKIWRRLPLQLTTLIGPLISKNIP